MNPFIGQNFKLNGNQLASIIGHKIKNNIKQFIHNHQSYFKQPIPKPKLQIFNIGHDIGSLSYIRKKMQTANQLGIQYHLRQFNVFTHKNHYKQNYHQVFSLLQNINTSMYSLYQINLQNINQSKSHQQTHQFTKSIIKNQIQPIINSVNQDPLTSSLFIQLPLPELLRPFTQQLIKMISPFKDVDCLTPRNRMQVLDHKSIPQLLPCTPRAVLKILHQNNIKIHGMNAVMIGRSDLVGKPLSHLLLNLNATTTVCHKYTKDVNFFTKNADLVISAAGVPNLVKQVKNGVILIDVGISRNQNGKLSGDISQQSKLKSSFYTPFPGGVGPLTVIMLMQNAYHLWKAQILHKIELLKRKPLH